MVSSFEFRFDDAIEFANKMSAAPGIVQREMVTAVDRLVLTGVSEAMNIVPVRTGHLRRSIASEGTSWTGGGAVGRYGTSTTYAPYVEYGTWKMGAQPYMKPSMETVRSQADAEFAAMLRSILVSIGVG